MSDFDRSAQGKVCGHRTQAKRFEDYPLTLEQAARYAGLPISLLRQGMTGRLIDGVKPPKVWQMAGRVPYFQVVELDRFIAEKKALIAVQCEKNQS